MSEARKRVIEDLFTKGQQNQRQKDTIRNEGSGNFQVIVGGNNNQFLYPKPAIDGPWTVPCPNCKNPVSGEAYQCIHCSHPVAEHFAKERERIRRESEYKQLSNQIGLLERWAWMSGTTLFLCGLLLYYLPSDWQLFAASGSLLSMIMLVGCLNASDSIKKKRDDLLKKMR